jgi:hypothetical protein
MNPALVQNTGRLVNFINGITGVAAGGNAIVNMPVNVRMHRLVLQCAAINYTGGTGLATVKITGAGNNAATVTPTIVNGVPTAIAVVAGGAGYVTGDTLTFTDATGTGFVGTVTAAAGAVTAVAVTVAGTASPVSPATFFSSIQQIVNGVIIRDITPDNILKIVQAQGYYPSLGELPLLYTTPGRNFVQRNDVTSWDLFGQSTYSIKMNISATVSLPSLVGIQEFDYQRNVKPSADGKSEVPFLEPVSQHQFTWPIVSGRNDITTLPYDFPITRMWLQGSTPGNISQVEVYQDGNKVFEATDAQIEQIYQEYGFTFGRPDWFNTTYAGSNAVKAAYNPPAYFDNAFVADPDGRWSKRLSVANNLILRVYSGVAQTLTIVQEAMPGQYA